MMSPEDSYLAESINKEECDAIIGQFMSYLKTGQEMDMEFCDLNAILMEAVNSESNVIGEIETLEPGSMIVNGNPLAIKRAITNMIVNAYRYGNGWIKVSSGKRKTPFGSKSKMTVQVSRRRHSSPVPAICTG